MKLNPLTHNFDTQSEYFGAIYAAGMGFAKPDARLMNAAATAIASGSTGADGGFLMPPAFEDEIRERIFEDPDSSLGLCDVRGVKKSIETFPTDDTPSWATSGGVRVGYADEIGPIEQSKLKVGALSVRARKLATVMVLTNELKEDSNIGAYIERTVPRKFKYKLTQLKISGLGAGEMLGVLNSPALITVAAEASQTAATFNTANACNMWSRMWSGGYARAVWMIGPDVPSVLPHLNSTGLNIFTPGDAEAPVGRIFGRPVIVHEACEALGDLGDVLLADWGEYLLAFRTPAPRQSASIHCYFDRDLQAFKFTWRVDGMPWWGAPVPSRTGNLTRSPFVALAAR
ncbi:MAG: phage major capsid protein [Hyphomonadaceae bacterium]|nr:phage major capsid protein [Hyphomonadaceae bacterium]